MTKQLTLDFDDDKGSYAGEFMLWYEKDQATPEQAIKNAWRYFSKKYGMEPVRVVLPPKWKRNGNGSIKTDPLEESLGLEVDTNPLIQTRHIAVYGKQKE